MKCPKCNSVIDFCEEVNVPLGEVVGYHCNACGYDNENDIEIDFNNKMSNLSKDSSK